MPKLQRILRSNGTVVYSLNLPLEIVESLLWMKGDNISAELQEDKIVLVKQNG